MRRNFLPNTVLSKAVLSVTLAGSSLLAGSAFSQQSSVPEPVRQAKRDVASAIQRVPKVAADLERLKRIQQQIAAVAKTNMDACVAISDGEGIGTGVIVNREGLVLTVAHVMGEKRSEFEIFFPDGRTVTARGLGKNFNHDMGMIQLPPGDWPFVELGNSDQLREGDWVVSLGHSGGFELGRRPPVRTGRLLSRMNHHLITDAVLIGGDSGGPLFDLDGKLIGIHSSIGDSITENRHVRIERFREDWDRLVRGEAWGSLPVLASDRPVEKAKLGVTLDLKQSKAVIKRVKPNSAAAYAGLQRGDVVVAFDSERISDGRHLIREVGEHVPNDTCFMTIRRDGEIIQVEVRLQ